MKIIKYNISIFKFWFKYILLKTPFKREAIEFLEKSYNATEREKRLIDRVKKLNKQVMTENYTLLELYEMYSAGVLTSEMLNKCLN